MELLGPFLIVMAIESVILVLTHVITELKGFQRLGRFIYNLKNRNYNHMGTNQSHIERSVEEKNTEYEDDDVAKERNRIENGYQHDVQNEDSDILRTYNLTKVFTNSTIRGLLGLHSEDNIAVDNVSVGIKRGECFGWLGLNGAGKSTTFKMLSNIFLPTSGRFELSFLGENERSNVGYCPQVDSLDPFITVEDLLRIYAKLKGISPKETDACIEKAIGDMELVSVYCVTFLCKGVK